MGASTAIFSVVNSVLLRPLPYPDSEHLVALNESQPPKSARLPVSPANFQDWSKQTNDIFENIYAETRAGFNLTDQGDPVRIQAGRVTHQMFDTLRIQPMLGRAFGAEEETPGKGNVVVLLYGFWLRQFGSRTDVIGKTIRLSGHPYTIIGVMPLSFKQGSSQAILMPLVLTDQERANRGNHFLDVFARLKKGVTLDQAHARMDVIATQLARQYPDTNKGFGVSRAFLARCPHAKLTSAALNASRRGHGPAADRPDKCRQPPAGPRHDPGTRNLHSHGHRRQPLAHRPAAFN